MGKNHFQMEVKATTHRKLLDYKLALHDSDIDTTISFDLIITALMAMNTPKQVATRILNTKTH